jgi:N utilization substance protein A
VTRFEGALAGFDISRQEAEEVIMAARVKAGLVSEADLAPPDEAPGEQEPATV